MIPRTFAGSLGTSISVHGLFSVWSMVSKYQAKVEGPTDPGTFYSAHNQDLGWYGLKQKNGFMLSKIILDSKDSTCPAHISMAFAWF